MPCSDMSDTAYHGVSQLLSYQDKNNDLLGSALWFIGQCTSVSGAIKIQYSMSFSLIDYLLAQRSVWQHFISTRLRIELPDSLTLPSVACAFHQTLDLFAYNNEFKPHSVTHTFLVRKDCCFAVETYEWRIVFKYRA